MCSNRQPETIEFRARDLPAVTAGFVGREVELDMLLPLVMTPGRLVTLTGMGGIGKTQLAAEAVRRFRNATGIPVRWIRLAHLARDSGRAAIEAEIAGSGLGTDVPVGPAAGRRTHALLVLDNCEHVRSGVAAALPGLLDTMSGLTVLTTSREALGADREQTIVVPPLSRSDALTLFRYGAALVGYPLEDDWPQSASAICGHLHDNPLYIRLAAARLERRPLRSLLDGLNGEAGVDQRLRWHAPSRVGADDRHHGIYAAIAWSYDLCGDEERLLFERMSVFAPGRIAPTGDTADIDAGSEAAAIEAVCADDADIDAAREAAFATTRLHRGKIETLLEQLVRRSLVSVQRTPTGARYSLTESVRVFAQERLRERDAAAAGDPVRRHLRYYRNRVVDAAAQWFGPREDTLIRWLPSAWPDVRTAIRAGLGTPADAVPALEICAALQAVPVSPAPSLRELQRLTERAMTVAGSSAAAELRLRATAALAWTAVRQGLFEDAERLLEQCVVACDLEPDQARHWRDTAAIDIGLPAVVEFVWGCELWLVRRDGAAIGVLARAREKFERNHEWGMAARCAVSAVAGTALLRGPEQAERLVGPLRVRADAGKSRWTMAWADLSEAIALIERGDAPRATALIARAVSYLASVGDRRGVVWALTLRIRALAPSIAGIGPRRAAAAAEIARLSGIVGTVGTELGTDTRATADLVERTTAAVAVARDLLGAKAFAAAHARGARLRLDPDGLAHMLSGASGFDRSLRSNGHGSAADSRWNELSRSERHVALLAAAGWTNTAIAARRGTSVRTVHAQMAATLHKLMITSRRDIAEFVPVTQRLESLREAARPARSDSGRAGARGTHCHPE